MFCRQKWWKSTHGHHGVPWGSCLSADAGFFLLIAILWVGLNPRASQKRNGCSLKPCPEACKHSSLWTNLCNVWITSCPLQSVKNRAQIYPLWLGKYERICKHPLSATETMGWAQLPADSSATREQLQPRRCFSETTSVKVPRQGMRTALCEENSLSVETVPKSPGTSRSYSGLLAMS